MVLEKLDIHMRSKGPQPLPHTTHKTQFESGLPWWLRGLKRLPAMRETWVRSLGWEDPLKKEMATHCSILAWILWMEKPGGLQPMGLERVGHD